MCMHVSFCILWTWARADKHSHMMKTDPHPHPFTHPRWQSSWQCRPRWRRCREVACACWEWGRRARGCVLSRQRPVGLPPSLPRPLTPRGTGPACRGEPLTEGAAAGEDGVVLTGPTRWVSPVASPSSRGRLSGGNWSGPPPPLLRTHTAARKRAAGAPGWITSCLGLGWCSFVLSNSRSVWIL